METLMEEDSRPTPCLPQSDLQECTKGPRTSPESPQVNGEIEDTLWEEMEVPVNKFHMEHQMHADFLQMLNEEDDDQQWQPLVLPVYPMAQPPTSLSFATVPWDAPDPSTPSPGTDNSSADELESSGAASLDWTVSPLCRYRSQEEDAEPHVEDERENLDEMEGLLPVKSTVDDGEHEAQPFDQLAGEEELPSDEEGTAPDLAEANGEILLRSESAEEMKQSVAENAVTLVESSIHPEDSVLERDSSTDSSLKEEPEKLDILLTGQTDLSQEPSLTTTSAETEEATEERRKEDEEKVVVVTNGAGNDDGEEGRSIDSAGPCEKEPAEESSQSNSAEGMSGQLIHTERSEQLLEEELSNNTGSMHDDEPLKRTHELDEFEEQPKSSEGYEQSEPSSGACPNLAVELWEHAERNVDVGEEPATCEEVNQEAAAQESGASPEPDHDRDPQTQQTEIPEELENSGCPEEAERMEPADQMSCPDQQLEQTQLAQLATTSEESQPIETERTEAIEQPTEELPQIEQSDQMESLNGVQHSEQTQQPEPTVRLEQSRQAEEVDGLVQSALLRCVRASEASETSEGPRATEQQLEQTGELQPSSDSEPSACPGQPGEPREAEQARSERNEPVPADVSEPSVGSKLPLEDRQAESPDQTKHIECAEVASSSSTSSSISSSSTSLKDAVENEDEEPHPSEKAQHMNGGVTDAERASRLAERLHNLDGIRRTDVVKHLDKDNDYSRAVGEAYLKFFDFTGQTLDEALRSFLKVVVLIGETQERERVLQHFSTRFHQCNPQSFPSAAPVLTLTCALMLLNTDLHGQNVGKAMTSSNFVSNLEGMNEGENFNKDLLKSFYNSLKSEPLEWAVDEKELQTSMLLEDDAKEDAPARSKSNPFQDVPHNKKATVFKQGFLQRKAHANIDGKRIPWGKRSWKTFYGVLKGMVLYLQKDEYRKDYQSSEEVVSVHHALAERATDYTKKPHVFRLQTADWRVFLFQASSRVEMYSWIGRINLVSALHSSPPFPAAVGSQRRFCRPILPASQSAQTLERQLKSHAGMLESFQEDLNYLQQNIPEGRKAKAKELEEHRVREGYLTHEKCRYEVYIQVLEVWKGLKKTGDAVIGTSELNLFDGVLCKACAEETTEDEETDGTLKKSHSSPSLELDVATPPVVKVRRNISERRTYRRIIVPRRNKEL